ncbi:MULTISPECIES: mechanosensitive ion channel family protein [unclassified Arenibacter]|uniref:mechanosensitive ion channel family protein n=1 Tax=unclassified Arenibacter TaxID=2615047 RepID=UPI000E353E71|nr:MULTISPECIES: mechanosensitive ion channel family protein [unclassified Arenibacter]MCM4164517.1 mechanosensitive ion channel protein MscS [Arenibacter sp. A80]RFT55603.1 mechanosensitive ion channel family protein [Arenibacter sp. P308M17]
MELNIDEAWKKMTKRLVSWADNLIVNLPNIILAMIVFTLVILLSKYVTKITWKLLEKSSLQKSMKNLIAKLISIMVILAGLFLVLGILDLSKTLNTILAGAGVAGLAVGLALQGALTNTYSGIVLSYIRHIKFGDWIESNDYEGEVIDIDLRAVTIKQSDNNLVYIPNKLVLENPIRNFSTTAQSRVILKCGVSYSSNLEFVRDLVCQTIISNFENIGDAKEIIFLYTEFGDSSINFETRFWIKSTNALEVLKAKTVAMIAIKKAFDDNGINIPFPIRTLDFPENFKNNDPTGN